MTDKFPLIALIRWTAPRSILSSAGCFAIGLNVTRCALHLSGQ